MLKGPSGGRPSAEAPPGPFEHLRDLKYLSLATRRKNGQEVATPMWFIVEGDRIYMRTGERTGKAKRLRNDPHVTIAPCGPSGRVTGPSMSAVARFGDPALLEAVNRGIKQKYGLFKRLVDFVNRLRGVTDIVVIELTANAETGRRAD